MMKQDRSKPTATINTKAIIIGMLLMFIIVHVGFHATYIKYFPEFKEFSWLHHIHGALMGSWVLMLVVQPILIHKHKYKTHRFIGKLSYVIAPLIVVSMLLIAKFNYKTGILEKTAADVMAIQSITWMQLLLFVLFYSLAIFYRKDTNKHLRFMIATAIVMIGPPLNRILFVYFPDIGEDNILSIVLYLKTSLVAVLFLYDISKKKNWTPYFIVLLAFLFSDLVYHAQYSDAWQAFGRFIIKYIY